MIAVSVPEIHCTLGDPDFRGEERRGEEELGILVVGCVMCMAVHITHSCEMSPCISQILSSPFSSKKES